MSVSDAEAKWEKAKKAVDKSKYPEDDAYYAVVTKIFKNMMHEELPVGTILNFDKFISEIFGFSRSETDANRQMTSSGSKKTDDKSESRKQDIQNAAWKHVVSGNHKKAFDAAYSVAKAHAKEDRYGDDTAHEIATRKAKHAVKTAVELHTKKR